MFATYQEIQGIKVVALDIFGTVLATDDSDNYAKPRKGLATFFDKCDSRRIRVVTASDGHNDLVKALLKDCFKKHPLERMSLDRFDSFFQLVQTPKDFSIIIGHYDLIPNELLVIGDNPKKDIEGAARLGCLSCQVPEYRLEHRDDFDFGKIEF